MIPCLPFSFISSIFLVNLSFYNFTVFTTSLIFHFLSAYHQISALISQFQAVHWPESQGSARFSDVLVSNVLSVLRVECWIPEVNQVDRVLIEQSRHEVFRFDVVCERCHSCERDSVFSTLARLPSPWSSTKTCPFSSLLFFQTGPFRVFPKQNSAFPHEQI